MKKAMKSLAGVFSSWAKKPQSGDLSKTENGYTMSSISLVEQKMGNFGSIATNYYITDNTSNPSLMVNNSENTLIVNGRDIMAELDEMRDALLLLKRDVDMEAKYPRLKELKDEYDRALEKYKTFEALK